MAAQSRGSALPDTTAVPLADEGADNHSPNICPESGAARIYGMIFTHRAFVQNQEQLKQIDHTLQLVLEQVS